MRKSGILMPIFSLPSRYGIGTFGKEAYKFVDFLKKAGQSYWQILPLNPTSYGDSPYQSFSSFAGNPYFIDLTMLIDEGLLTKQQADSYDFGSENTIAYDKLYKHRKDCLHHAFLRFEKTPEYLDFCGKNAFWLDDYALFMTIKSAQGDCAFCEWDTPFKNREKDALESFKKHNAQELDFHRFIQYKFTSQWFSLKKYANERGIKIIGDIPIYVALDSADVWADREQFLLNADARPTLVAGCPPDAFSEDGQLWGNPLYDWVKMKGDGYAWWKQRLSFALSLYDVVRIDHFRGFESFYAIPFGDKTAKNGTWQKGPDIDLFCELKEEFGEDIPIIAEDLGFMTDEVKNLLKNTGFPGMKVLQFAFDSREESDYLPHNYDKNCVVYTGTHDNDTILGWAKSAPERDVEYAKKYLDFKGEDGFNFSLIRAAMASVADTAILFMPDLLSMGSEGRINTPSTLGGNWQLRIKAERINDALANTIYDLTELYCRLPNNKLKSD